MAAKSYTDDSDQLVDVTFDSRDQFDWVVQEDLQLQDELNQLLGRGEEISTAVVNKVLDRIRDL
ncbi:MAG TPA: hypothetical protein ENG59_06960 [Chloroflexi bacterium]|nr:MAG: hypothetical protein DRI46_02610 [Chloroflexota bacterium]HDD55961.1 hypothetical protein [Chloroflexota bacterium]